MAHDQDTQSPASWINMVSDARALQVDPDDWLEGKNLISIETQSQIAGTTMTRYISENFASFLHYAAMLHCEVDRQILLAYYLCRKNQAQIAETYGLTQTGVSQRMVRVTRLLVALMAWGGEPGNEYLAFSFEHFTTACWFIRYRALGCDMELTAEEFGVWRPTMRKALVKASEAMCASEDWETAGVGEYVGSLLGSVRGHNRRNTKAHLRVIHRKDPDCLGEWRHNISELPVLYAPTNDRYAEWGGGGVEPEAQVEPDANVDDEADGDAADRWLKGVDDGE